MSCYCGKEFGGTIAWTEMSGDGRVSPKQKESKYFEIRPVGHRKFTNFVEIGIPA